MIVSALFFWVRSRIAIRDDRGAVAAEYGLLLVLIAIVIIVATTAFGIQLAGLFQRGADSLPLVP